MRALTEKEKKLVDEDEVGCMDPRARQMVGIVAIAVLTVILGLLGSLIYWVIRSII